MCLLEEGNYFFDGFNVRFIVVFSLGRRGVFIVFLLNRYYFLRFSFVRSFFRRR